MQTGAKRQAYNDKVEFSRTYYKERRLGEYKTHKIY